MYWKIFLQNLGGRPPPPPPPPGSGPHGGREYWLVGEGAIAPMVATALWSYFIIYKNTIYNNILAGCIYKTYILMALAFINISYYFWIFQTNSKFFLGFLTYSHIFSHKTGNKAIFLYLTCFTWTAVTLTFFWQRSLIVSFLFDRFLSVLGKN